MKRTNHQIKFLLWAILALTFMFSVSAQPPFQTSEDIINSLNIIVPKESAFKLDGDIKLHFHVFNSSGNILFANQTTCNIHIYGHDGNHLIDYVLEDGTETSVPYDKEIYLTAANLTGVGDYGYTTWCNSSTQAGFVSGTFEVTRNGLIASINDLPLIIAIFIIALSLFIISAQLKDEHFLFKLLSQLFALYFLYMIPSITLNSFNNVSLTFLKLFNGFIWVFWIYIFIYSVYALLNYMNKLASIKRGFNNIKRKYGKK